MKRTKSKQDFRPRSAIPMQYVQSEVCKAFEGLGVPYSKADRMAALTVQMGEFKARAESLRMASERLEEECNQLQEELSELGIPAHSKVVF